MVVNMVSPVTAPDRNWRPANIKWALGCGELLLSLIMDASFFLHLWLVLQGILCEFTHFRTKIFAVSKYISPSHCRVCLLSQEPALTFRKPTAVRTSSVYWCQFSFQIVVKCWSQVLISFHSRDKFWIISHHQPNLQNLLSIAPDYL